ncbi:MAG: c-type cytochrome biogenesis protein CcmI [Phenylobacterium sp.]|uniref:c-type cytochrome biogenesis protein CcmI n=1 Tax=Phenylobacterium sp. TaxID=1871053 RepID=UPI00391D46E1
MFLFWGVAGVLSAAAAALILLRAARAASDAGTPDPAQALYRRQLAEIDDLAGRGLLAEAERKSAHAEAARRLLAATDTRHSAWSASSAVRRPVLIAAVAAPLMAVGLYFVTGAPGFPDQPIAARVAAWRAADPAALTPQQMAAVLRAVLTERPDDAEGYRFLAIAEGASDNPTAAARALRRAISIAPERADLWEMLGETLVAEAGGEMSPPAERAFAQALARDPKSIAARFHLARAQVEGGDRAAGLSAWRALAAELPADDPRRAGVQAAIAQASNAAASPALPDATAIRGMVEGLAARLEAEPDDAEGWVRLVRSYAVLGETVRRDAALQDARRRFAGRPDVLSALNSAAAAPPMTQTEPAP